jgi:hypothetical protein
MRFRERKGVKERKKEASRRKESFPVEVLTVFSTSFR